MVISAKEKIRHHIKACCKIIKLVIAKSIQKKKKFKQFLKWQYDGVYCDNVYNDGIYNNSVFDDAIF